MIKTAANLTQIKMEVFMGNATARMQLALGVTARDDMKLMIPGKGKD